MSPADLAWAWRMFRAAERNVHQLHAAFKLEEIGYLTHDAEFGYAVQQATEKMLKARLTAQEVAFPLTQDLRLLLDTVAQAGENVEKYRPLESFTQFALGVRYTDEVPELPTEREEALAFVESLAAAVRGSLESDE